MFGFQILFRYYYCLVLVSLGWVVEKKLAECHLFVIVYTHLFVIDVLEVLLCRFLYELVELTVLLILCWVFIHLFLRDLLRLRLGTLLNRLIFRILLFVINIKKLFRNLLNLPILLEHDLLSFLISMNKLFLFEIILKPKLFLKEFYSHLFVVSSIHITTTFDHTFDNKH